MLIALAPDLFADTVMAELRGYFAEDGSCPFYDGVAHGFSRLPFAEADALVASKGHRWLADHSADRPFDTGHAPPGARLAIGRVHPQAEAARAMLAREGFVWAGLVDRLNGGQPSPAHATRSPPSAAPGRSRPAD